MNFYFISDYGKRHKKGRNIILIYSEDKIFINNYQYALLSVGKKKQGNGVSRSLAVWLAGRCAFSLVYRFTSFTVSPAA